MHTRIYRRAVDVLRTGAQRDMHVEIKKNSENENVYLAYTLRGVRAVDHPDVRLIHTHTHCTYIIIQTNRHAFLRTCVPRRVFIRTYVLLYTTHTVH